MRKTGIFIFCLSLNSHAFSSDLDAFLGRNEADLRKGLDSVSSCTQSPHTIKIPVITERTEIRSDLFSPVSGSLFVDDSTSEFTHSPIGVTTCEIQGSASIRSYSQAGKIFRISVTYSRCKKIGYAGCAELDSKPRAYDAKIYAAMSHKDAYIDSDDGSFYIAFRDVIANPMSQNYVYELSCGRWVSEFIFNRGRTSKCIADISFKDGVFAATTVFEVFEDGYLTDALVGRFAGERIFVDIKAEQQAIYDLAERMKKIVEPQKAEILKLSAEKKTNETRIDELLGPASNR